jgi:hypothetical protein
MKRHLEYQSSVPSLNSTVPRLPALSNSPKSRQSETISYSKLARASPRVKSDGEKFSFPTLGPSAVSKKRCGYVLCYAANSHQGLVRTMNEDRLGIIINIPCPQTFSIEKWPHSSFFGVYDGHGGKLCANFLKENLHKYVFDSEFFPARPKEALFRAFESG